MLGHEAISEAPTSALGAAADGPGDVTTSAVSANAVSVEVTLL
jgi:hypothetical protein